MVKRIVSLGVACVLAAPVWSAPQQAPTAEKEAVAPGVVSAPKVTEPLKKEVSAKAREVAAQVLALMKEVSATLHSITDKASADAAAAKVKDINARGDALAKNAQGVKEEINDAMDAHKAELIPVYMQLQIDGQRIKKANFFGSESLKAALSNLNKAATAPAK